MSETIIGIKVLNRENSAIKVQEVITKYGCNIRTRIGLHQADEKICSPYGLIILQMSNKVSDYSNMIKELKKIKEITVKKMNI